MPGRPLGWSADGCHGSVHPPGTQALFAAKPGSYAIASGKWAVLEDLKNRGKQRNFANRAGFLTKSGRIPNLQRAVQIVCNISGFDDTGTQIFGACIRSNWWIAI